LEQIIENLFQIITPVFALLATGFLAMKLGLMQSSYSEGLNRFVYYLGYPTLLFIVIARTPFQEILRFDFLGAWSTSLIVGYFLVAGISLLLLRDGLGAMGMRGFNASCGNTSMIGFPLCVAAFGQEMAIISVLATVLNAVIGVSLTVLLIETSTEKKTSVLDIARSILKSFAKNPLLIAFCLGLLVSFFYGKPPVVLTRFCEILGAAAIPCSLVATGLFFAGNTQRISYREASLVTFWKLLIQPMVTWIIAVKVFKIEPKYLAVILLHSALPLASTCFVISQRYNTLTEETSSTTILSTLVSFISLSILLWWFGTSHFAARM
jgi:malonate transporter and related proteins